MPPCRVVSRLLGVLLFVAATSTHAAETPAPQLQGPVPAPGAVASGKPYGYGADFFAGLWSKRRQAINKGDFMGADRLLEELVTAKLRAGYPDLFAYAESVAWESRALGAAGDWKRALDLGLASVELGPHRLNTHLAVASAHWGLGAWKNGLDELRAGLRLIVEEPPYRMVRLGNLLLAFLGALVVASLAYAFALLYRHLAPLWHDVGHLLPVGSLWWQYAVLMLALVAWPVLFRCGVVWAVAWWLLMVVPYQRGTERWASAAVLGTLLVVTLTLPLLTAYLAYPRSRSEALYRISRDIDATDALALLRSEDPPTPETLYALGMRARWQGDADKSRAFLEKAQQAGMPADDVVVGLGNDHFLAGDYAGAEHIFAELVNAQPRHLLGVFNLAAARAANNDAPGAAELRKRASELDPATTARWTAIADRTGLGVREPTVPYRVLATSFDAGNDHARAADQLWRALGGIMPRLAVAGLLAFTFLWTLIMAILAKKNRRAGTWAGACLRCGDAACRRCVPDLIDVERCVVCTEAMREENLRNPQDDAAQALRIRKEIDSHRYHARLLKTQRLFNVLLAGAGHLLRGAPWRGLLLMVTFVTCVLAAFQGTGVLPEPLPAYRGFSGLFTVVYSILLVVLYTVAVVSGRHEEN